MSKVPNLKPLVNNEALWAAYVEHIELEKKRVFNLMVHSKDTEELLRLQGEARSLEYHLRLRERTLRSES